MLAMLILGSLQAAPAHNEAWIERHHPAMPVLAPCEIGEPATLASKLVDLPAPVKVELDRLFKKSGGLADANGEFNASDYIDDQTVPTRRFIRAYHVRDVWLIWTERGGFVRQRYIFAVKPDASLNGVPVYHLDGGSFLAGDLCVASKAYLAGARSSVSH